MRKEDYIADKVGRRSPFVVPDDYVDQLITNVEQNLPPYPEMPAARPLSLWQKVRPYVYMAAMFAGIWCMMKVFHSLAYPQNSLDSAPEAIAMVMENPEDYDVAVESDEEYDYFVEGEVADEYRSFEELQNDLGITLSADYSMNDSNT